MPGCRRAPYHSPPQWAAADHHPAAERPDRGADCRRRVPPPNRVPARLLASLSPHELDAVLLHEIAHHRRGHIASGWVRAAVCAAWWWNPLAWMVGRALRHTQEEVCDDLVIERAGMAADRYCDVLVHAASVASTPAGAAAFAQALHPLGRRVKRLLEGAPARASAWQVC